MKLDDFLVEQWMNDYEGMAVHDLTSTCGQALTCRELLDLEPGILEDVELNYGSITGDPRLRSEILSLYQNQDPHTLTLAQGCLQANEMVMETVLEPGDEVIAYTPGYQQFYSYPEALGCQVHLLRLEPDSWSFPLDRTLELIETRPGIRMILMGHPSNPTGTFMKEEELSRLISACRAHGIWLFCDEVYFWPDSGLSVADLYEKGVATSSLSKLYGLAGLRSGWIKACPELIHAIDVRRDYTIISTGPLTDTLSYAALLHKEELLARVRKTVQKNTEIVKNWLQDNPLFSCSIEQDSLVAFLRYHKDISSADLARSLLRDTGIFFVPGSCFGLEHHLRLGLGTCHEDLKAVLEQLQTYVQTWEQVQ